METLQLSHIPPGLAASLLAGCEQLDPSGMTAPDDLVAMTAAGHCFAATAGNSQAMYVLKVRNGVTWISAMKGEGTAPWLELLLPVIESQAVGCDAVAFQTRRPGLVRAVKKQGYEITGWILKKKIT